MPLWFLPDECLFPHPLTASDEGIVAIGGDLSVQRLTLAYSFGIFPWYSQGDPIVWWYPDPRCVMHPAEVVVSHSMRSVIRKNPWTVTVDRAFTQVISHCRETSRSGQAGTWIQPEMVDAYVDFHHAGFAHSLEVWDAGTLVGGLYGVSLGKIFFGESMFSLVPNASKYAFIALAQFLERRDYVLIDCQQETDHLRSLGAGLIPAVRFYDLLSANRRLPHGQGKWSSGPLHVNLPP